MRRWRDLLGWLGIGCSGICLLGLSFLAAWLPASAAGWLHNESLTRAMLLMALAMFLWGTWGSYRLHGRLLPGVLALAGAALLSARAWGLLGLAAGWIGLGVLAAAWLWDRRLMKLMGGPGCSSESH
ncbi:MAG: MerC domain-containing protein [Elusimicrobia bacterium]|nr:MerC domain-containing protein [Elusimicrobiota bacterium]